MKHALRSNLRAKYEIERLNLKALKNDDDEQN